MKRLGLLQLLLVILFIPIMCRTAFAHKVSVFAWQDGEKIVTEARFSRGNPARNSTISVIELKTGKQILSGTTDANGLFSFPIPRTDAKELKIIVDAGDGHKNSWNYTLEDSAANDQGSPLPQAKAAAGPASDFPASGKSPDNTLQTLTAPQLTEIIDKALDKKLAPINRTLAESTDRGPTMQDILGGIGYLVGLAGIVAYMQSLKNKKE